MRIEDQVGSPVTSIRRGGPVFHFMPLYLWFLIDVFGYFWYSAVLLPYGVPMSTPEMACQSPGIMIDYLSLQLMLL